MSLTAASYMGQLEPSLPSMFTETKSELRRKERIVCREEEQLHLQQAWHHLMRKDDRL